MRSVLQCLATLNIMVLESHFLNALVVELLRAPGVALLYANGAYERVRSLQKPNYLECIMS